MAEHCDALLAACEKMCYAIRFLGESKSSSYYSAFIYEDGHEDTSIDYVETHWKEHLAICLGDAYEIGQAAIAKAKTERASPGPLPQLP